MNIAVNAAWMLVSFLSLPGCVSEPEGIYPSASKQHAQHKQVATEHRGLWVATVANIDWPTSKTLTDAQRRAEMIRILDTARDLGLTAIYFQARPCGDAMYKSALEPWSEFLTGKSGTGPTDKSDPLAEWVKETHARGMELHVWLNPFRVGHPQLTGIQADNHPARRLAAVTREYGDYKWLDPGEPVAREHSLSVIEDIAARYEIDGLHIDDYFYPYPVKLPSGVLREFPDDGAWKHYQSSGGKFNRGDWRRENINGFLAQMTSRARAVRPKLVIGISPFGIWQPNHPPGVQGFNSHEGLYADAKKWLNEGSFDYMAPQLYWKVDAPQQPFKPLLDWWVSQNTHGKHVYAGLNVSRVGPDAAKDFSPLEITRQIDIIRATPGAGGFILFSARPIVENRVHIREILKAKIAEK